MSQSTVSRALPQVLGAAATIGLGMIPLHRLPRAVKTGYIVLPAAFVAGTVLFALQRGAPRTAEQGEEAPPALRAPTAREGAISLALGGFTAGAGAAGIAVDRGIEGLLRRRGVPAPRVWMGISSGALMLALNGLEDRAPEPDGAEPLEERIRALLTEADPMQLTPGRQRGTPSDEYQPEAEAITEILRAEGAISAARLDVVWQHWFERPLTPLLGAVRVAALAAELTAQDPEVTTPPNAR